MNCLRAARSIDLPDWYLGAGFLRNAIWDHLHHKQEMTPLNDVDLVYFDPENTSLSYEEKAVESLRIRCPHINWEVRNQARMHMRHGHPPYSSTTEGLSYWVEVPTCVGVRLTNDNKLEFAAPYGLEENWSLKVKINPLNPRSALFKERIESKLWLNIWPELHIEDIGN